MRLKTTRILLLLVVVVALALLGVFIFAVDPEQLSQVMQWTFFGLGFLFFQGLMTVILLSLAQRFLGEERAALYQGDAVRQGVLLALLLVGIVITQYFRILTWWNAAFLVVFLLLLELTYRHFQTSRH